LSQRDLLALLRYLEGQFGDEIQHENAIERLIARR